MTRKQMLFLSEKLKEIIPVTGEGSVECYW